MKALHFILIIYFLVCQSLYGQNLIVSPTMEKTIVNIQYGVSASFEVPSLWRFGSFYQTSFSKSERYVGKDSYWGMIVSAPVVESDKLIFYANIRMGLINKYFFLINPVLQTDIKISKRFFLSVGMSVRKGYLSGIASVNVKI